MRKIIPTVFSLFAIGFIAVLSVATFAADNKSAPSKDDIRAACAAVTEACLDACEKAVMTGPESNTCKNGCGNKFQACIDSVASKGGGVLSNEPTVERPPVAADNTANPSGDIAAACEATLVACEEACDAAKFTDAQRQQCGATCAGANDQCTGRHLQARKGAGWRRQFWQRKSYKKDAVRCLDGYALFLIRYLIKAIASTMGDGCHARSLSLCLCLSVFPFPPLRIASGVWRYAHLNAISEQSLGRRTVRNVLAHVFQTIRNASGSSCSNPIPGPARIARRPSWPLCNE